MKWIKLFESYKDIKNILNELDDICLELNDIGILTNAFYHNKSNIISIDMDGVESVIKWGDIYDILDRIITYLVSSCLINSRNS